MVELLVPNQVTRVRFPSPAPLQSNRHPQTAVPCRCRCRTGPKDGGCIFAERGHHLRLGLWSTDGIRHRGYGKRDARNGAVTPVDSRRPSGRRLRGRPGLQAIRPICFPGNKFQESRFMPGGSPGYGPWQAPPARVAKKLDQARLTGQEDDSNSEARCSMPRRACAAASARFQP